MFAGAENRGRGKLVLGLLVVILFVGAVFLRPGFRLSLKSWRSDYIADQAEVAISAQNWPLAWKKAHAAHRADATNPQGIRVLARLHTLAGDTNAVAYWDKLRATGKGTMEDRRQYVRAAMRFGNLSAAQSEALRLAAEVPTIPANLRIAAECFLAGGDLTNALKFSAEFAKGEPGPMADLLAAQVALRSTEPTLQRSAVASLQQLSRLRNVLGTEAQLILARAGLLPERAIPDFVARLARYPGRDVSHRLLEEELLLRVKPEQKASVVAQLMRDYRTSAITNRVAVGRWFNLHGEFARTLELIPAQEGRTNRDAFLLRIDSMPPLGKWKEARGELLPGDGPLEALTRELYLVRSAQELKLRAEAEQHWRKALEIATGAEDILKVAEFAERTGAREPARQAYRRLTSFQGYTDKGLAGLKRIGER